MITRERRPAAVALLAGIMAFTVQATMVKHFAVNVPFLDEWTSLVSFVARDDSGLLRWSDVLAPHMEHRIVVSRLAFMLVYRVFGEASLLGCLLISALLMGSIAGIWAYTLERLGEPRWLVLVSLPILLSVAQYENMLWGFQICFYALVLPMIAAICFLAVAQRLSWPAMCGLAAACAISSFSMASGLLSWGVIGAVLCMRARLESSSLRDLLGRRDFLTRLAAFGAMAAVTMVVYLWGYAPARGPSGPGTGAAIVVRYIGMAFVYPILDWKNPSHDALLPFAVIVVATPIVIACAYHWRRRDRARLLLMSGLVLMVVTHIALLAYARGHQLWIAGYYGTVLAWASAVSVMGVADLMRAVRGARRAWWKAPALGMLGVTAVFIVGGQLSAYPRAFQAIKDYRADRLTFERNVLTYLWTATESRSVPEKMPFPPAYLHEYLDDLSILRVLPAGFRPLVAKMDLSGNAWTIDGAYPSIPRPPGYLVLGSWSGRDLNVGTLKALDLPRSGLTLLVAGYPSAAGNSLRVESANVASGGASFPGPDPGERWVEWRLDPAVLPNGPMSLVAVDGARDVHGWFAIGVPVIAETAAVRRLRMFFEWIEIEGAIAMLAVAMCVWLKYRSDRRVSSVGSRTV